ncbi:putative prolyl 4-hydroxylase alpha subunit homologue [Lyophyllum shimeji]|uniref:Prolyl 4-hydroxylase alpha subunit homologue n=1 Tax=Lyophyllum shimeji TaxID=47721 RepID=A0A9P3PNR5_LYOSH|nr:putative prolyl 4-hydroxylase alpha subunit homologue [Lyophyllum shimeji]
MNPTQQEVTVTPVDFSQTPLSSPYTGFYAKVIDGLFTASDCSRLLSLASSSAGGWKPAGLSTRGPEQTVHSNFRHSDRVLVVDEEHARWIYEKLRPYVEEIHEIEPRGMWGGVTGKAGRTQGPAWVLTGVNPRLSFLRYGPGHYFKPHCDGLIEVGNTKSFVTLHLYLNDSVLGLDPLTSISNSTSMPDVKPPTSTPLPNAGIPEPGVTPSPTAAQQHDDRDQPAAGDNDVPLHGGATRFWTPNKKAYLDVHPKLGRVLIFQQRTLVHSGEEVTQGVKHTVRSDFMFDQKGKGGGENE